MRYQLVLTIYVAILITFSLISFFLYGRDKKMASRGNNVRIKERTLLFFTSFGGSFGAFLGRIIFRHKTDKKYFSLVIYISLLLQLGALALIIYRNIA
jgi:uncharacterized membrane protein YsdA (DUF1294 family)